MSTSGQKCVEPLKNLQQANQHTPMTNSCLSGLPAGRDWRLIHHGSYGPAWSVGEAECICVTVSLICCVLCWVQYMFQGSFCNLSNSLSVTLVNHVFFNWGSKLLGCTRLAGRKLFREGILLLLSRQAVLSLRPSQFRMWFTALATLALIGTQCYGNNHVICENEHVHRYGHTLDTNFLWYHAVTSFKC